MSLRIAKLTKKMKDDFEELLVDVTMLLEDLLELLAHSRSYRDVRLGYDDATLERVEAYFLDALAGKEKLAVSQARLNRIFIAFVGEAVIARAESGCAKWALNPVARDPSFGTPVIIDWAKVLHSGSDHGLQSYISRFAPVQTSGHWPPHPSSPQQWPAQAGVQVCSTHST